MRRAWLPDAQKRAEAKNSTFERVKHFQTAHGEAVCPCPPRIIACCREALQGRPPGQATLIRQLQTVDSGKLNPGFLTWCTRIGHHKSEPNVNSRMA